MVTEADDILYELKKYGATPLYVQINDNYFLWSSFLDVAERMESDWYGSSIKDNTQIICDNGRLLLYYTYGQHGEEISDWIFVPNYVPNKSEISDRKLKIKDVRD